MARYAPVVTADLWRVRRGTLPAALSAVARDRARIRSLPGVRFAKVLGTARSFSGRDADLTRWFVVASWDDTVAAEAFRSGPVWAGWQRRASEGWHATLRPLVSRGRWSRQEPFAGRPVTDAGRSATGPVVALTRARLRLRHARTFWRAVPGPAADLGAQDGLLFALAMGEAPLGVQGTFSVWRDAAALRGFAYGRPAHRAVIRGTRDVGWYAEELFARFELVEATGTVDGLDPLAGTRPGDARQSAA